MKLKLLISLLFVLINMGYAGAIDGVPDETLGQGNALSTGLETTTDTQNTLSWPAIPGENLNDIARAFYPKSSTMRRLFISQTLRLNANLEPKLSPSRIFEEPTLLTIPTLKSLSKNRQAIKAQRAKVNRQKLNMSFSMDKAISYIPALLQQEYEALMSKNAFLKAELARLHQKISELQTTLSGLKLVLDKTLNIPDQTSSHLAASDITHPQQASLAKKTEIQNDTQAVPNAQPAKKTFKNLNENSTSAVNTVAQQVRPLVQKTHSALDLASGNEQKSSTGLLNYMLPIGLGLLVLITLFVYWIRKNRQRAFTHFKQSTPMMDDTITDYGGQWQDTEQGSEYIVEHEPQASTHNFMNTEMRKDQAKASSTLEEAKLLMTVNRTQDAIDHLKLSIETQPKSSINHWLYLLEIYRKLNAKEDFETYAQSLHRTFNVMTPVWYETNAPMPEAKIIVPQSLEEFPHIMDKLEAVWPSDLAKVYLESLITDNRDGERAGFSQAVLDEILMLIALLDLRKDLD